jgi:hypothetical protein
MSMGYNTEAAHRLMTTTLDELTPKGLSYTVRIYHDTVQYSSSIGLRALARLVWKNVVYL